jgi:hypothetical protein
MVGMEGTGCGALLRELQVRAGLCLLPLSEVEFSLLNSEFASQHIFVWNSFSSDIAAFPPVLGDSFAPFPHEFLLVCA